MSSCCTLFHLNPNEAVVPTLIEEDQCSNSCSCSCGYIQYESLIPYIDKLSNNFSDELDYLKLESKLRQQIIEISRFFDIETSADPGTYSKAHKHIKEVIGNGTSYLRVPEFVPGTLEVYTKDGYLIDPSFYIAKNGYLIFMPCTDKDIVCSCKHDGIYTSKSIITGWKGCYKIKANFGKECADAAIQLAIKTYIIELNTYGDVVETQYQGLPIARGFKVPHIWSKTVEKYRTDRSFQNQYGIA